MSDFTENITELIPIYGTYLIGKRFVNNPSWKGAGELALSAVGDAAMLSGVGAGVGAALKAGNAAVKAGKIAKTANALKKVGAARELKLQKPVGKTFHDVATEQFDKILDNAIISGQRVPEKAYLQAMSNFGRASDADVAVGLLDKAKDLFELGAAANGLAKYLQYLFGKYRIGGQLVSKNPILRFKEGKKIAKALNGTKVIATVDGRQFETTIEQAKRNGWEYFIPGKQAEFNKNYPYDKYSTKYRNSTSYLPAFIQDARFGDYRNGWTGETSDNLSGLVRDLEAGNLAWWPKTVRVPYVPTLKSQSNSSAQNVDTQNTLSKTTESLTQSKSNFLNNKSGSQKFTKGKSRKTSITPSVFVGYGIGKKGGLNYSINDDAKQLLIRTGQFTESDFTNALATQLALNRYFVNSGLGSIKEDNAWGDQSRKALEFALIKSKSLTPFNNETTIVKTPIVSTYTPPTTPINLEVSNLKLNVNVPQQTYDRTGVREFIRNKGINPYSFNGALRRALRMVLNNTANDNDKLLVKGMGLFKQGGQLISKNPVKRFKQRNFR